LLYEQAFGKGQGYTHVGKKYARSQIRNSTPPCPGHGARWVRFLDMDIMEAGVLVPSGQASIYAHLRHQPNTSAGKALRVTI